MDDKTDREPAFELHESATLTYEQWKVDFLRVVLRITSLVFLIAIISAWSTNPLASNLLYVFLVTLMAIAALTRLPYSVGAFVLLSSLFVGGTNILLIWGINADATMIFLGTIALTTLLFERRAELFALALTVGTIFFVAQSTISGQHILSGWVGLGEEFYSAMVATWIDWIVYAVDLIAVSLILIFAIRLLKGKFSEVFNEAKNSLGKLSHAGTELEQRVQERTAELEHATRVIANRAEYLRNVAEVSRAAASFQELDSLLPAITSQISQSLGYDGVSIYLLDEQQEHAILAASNFEAALSLLPQGYRIDVSDDSLLGFVTRGGQPRIASDSGLESVAFSSPAFPGVLSEIALPLRSSERVIGALDIQSTQRNAFNPEDISVLSILADQVAIAIQNANSSDQAKRALRDAELATRQLTGQAWKNYPALVQAKGYRYDGLGSQPLKQTSGLRIDADAVQIPIQLRGQVIGRLKLNKVDPQHQWTEDELAVARATAERVALALESARLLDEAQGRAARERTIGEISAKIGASVRTENILKTAAKELNQILEGAEVLIRLKTDEQDRENLEIL